MASLKYTEYTEEYTREDLIDLGPAVPSAKGEEENSPWQKKFPDDQIKKKKRQLCISPWIVFFSQSQFHLINVHASTEDASDDTKEFFYDQLTEKDTIDLQ